MSSTSPENPNVPGIPATRRELLVSYLLGQAQSQHLARFILMRALDSIALPSLEALVDEVDETFYGGRTDSSGFFDAPNGPDK